MDARYEELELLLHVQQLDLELMKSQKAFDELPQREMILAARQKKEALLEKRQKIEALKADAVKKVAKIESEDASLIKKQNGLQAAIEAASDFRNVEARTKELNGIAKRRTALVDEMEKATADFEKIEALEAQVVKAFEDVVAHENATIASFQKQGGSLKMAIAQLQQQRDRAFADLPDALQAAYAKAAKRGGGVAVGRLDGARCGVCRAGIEGGHLIELKNQAPLGNCPHCKRLLII